MPTPIVDEEIRGYHQQRAPDELGGGEILHDSDWFVVVMVVA